MRKFRKSFLGKNRLQTAICRLLFISTFVFTISYFGFWTRIGKWKLTPAYTTAGYKWTKRLLLVDVNEKHLTGLNPNYSNNSSIIRKGGGGKGFKNVHKILWYNLPKWIHPENLNKLWDKCPYSNCQHVSNISLIKQSSAVVYCTSMPGLSGKPPLQPSKRPNKQVWIMFGLESPATQKAQYDGYIPQWNNSMNWSMSYRFDSDIVMPYGYLETQTDRMMRNYSEIFRQKTKWAAWIVSKCRTPSLRENYVMKLKKHGLAVDIYGRCDTPLKVDPRALINNQYKFYLSFENSLCTDYISEKFFKYYNYDTIPIVRGGANYKHMVPNGTYIDVADFKSINDLVSHLLHIGSDEKLYTDYLRRKDMYTAKGNIKDTHLPYCVLCDKLNNLGDNMKIYQTVPTYMDTCYLPSDVDKI